jgi:PTH1 family peptidyl-tRNA hydrolase
MCKTRAPARRSDAFDARADNADHLVTGDDPGLQNRLHLALEAKGSDAVKRVGEVIILNAA